MILLIFPIWSIPHKAKPDQVKIRKINERSYFIAVTETVLGKQDIPWEVLKRRGHESVRFMELTRFYLELTKDPHGPDVALFIGNLPSNLSQIKYENILSEYLDEDSKFSSIGPIYYEYGSMVITFNDSESAVYAYETLRNCKHENKTLLGNMLMMPNISNITKFLHTSLVIMLPTVKPSMLPTGVVPLLVFVNVKSGGMQGQQLLSSFRKLLNPHQVFDLSNGGPLCG